MTAAKAAQGLAASADALGDHLTPGTAIYEHGLRRGEGSQVALGFRIFVSIAARKRIQSTVPP